MSQRTATILMAVSIVAVRKALQEMGLSVQVFIAMVLMDQKILFNNHSNNYVSALIIIICWTVHTYYAIRSMKL